MKKLLLAICVFFVTYIHAQPPSGPIAHWTFNGNSSDVSGNGHNGTDYNVTYGTGISGLSNTAAIFNGNSSYINVPYKADLNLTQFSIAAIIKPMGFYTGLCQVNSIMWRGQQYTPSNYGMYFFDNPYDQSCYLTDTSKNVFGAFAGANNGNGSQWQCAQKVVTNNWYKVIAVYAKDTIRIYANGTNVSTYVVTSGPMGSSTEGLWIGANYNSAPTYYPYWFNGLMDDLIIYDRVLDDSEITHYGDYLIIDSVNNAICQDKSFTVYFSTSYTYNAGNVFTAQLSDATGSFVTPSVLGTLTSTTSGTISCMTPTVPPGNNYKIRIVSSSPVEYSDIASVSVINPTISPTIAITATPGNVVTNGQTVVFSATTFNTSTKLGYQWMKNGVIIPGATSATYTAIAGTDFVNNDNIAVQIFDSSTCGTQHAVQSNTVTMQLSTGMAGVGNNYALNIYPNPSKGAFSIKGNFGNNRELWLRVENTIGQLVSMMPVIAENNIIHVNPGSLLADGMYTIKLFDQDKLYTAKLVIHQ